MSDTDNAPEINDAPSVPASAPILSGQPAQPAVPQPANFADPSIVPNALGDAPATSPLGGTQPAAPPQAAGTPSVWKNIVMGALYGATQGAGTKNFGTGAARGAQAVEQQAQQKLENAQRQQQLQFESVKAADSHIAALKQARAADDAHEEHAQQLSDQQQVAQEKLEELGFAPKVISATGPADGHAQATGMLQTLANQNGGSIPQVATTNAPDSTSTDGKTHTIHVYSASPQDVQNNPNGTAKLINYDRAVKGLPPLSDSEIQIAGGQAKPGNWRAGAAQIVLVQREMENRRSPLV